LSRPIFVLGLGSNIGRGLFVGWVEHPDIFCWVSFLYPTYLPAIFVLAAKPNKMVEEKLSPYFNLTHPDGMSTTGAKFSRKASYPEEKDRKLLIQSEKSKIGSCVSTSVTVLYIGD